MSVVHSIRKIKYTVKETFFYIRVQPYVAFFLPNTVHGYSCSFVGGTNGSLIAHILRIVPGTWYLVPVQ